MSIESPRLAGFLQEGEGPGVAYTRKGEKIRFKEVLRRHEGDFTSQVNIVVSVDEPYVPSWWCDSEGEWHAMDETKKNLAGNTKVKI